MQVHIGLWCSLNDCTQGFFRAAVDMNPSSQSASECLPDS